MVQNVAPGADRTKVYDYSPEAPTARHLLGADLAANLAGIDPLTDALVAPKGEPS